MYVCVSVYVHAYIYIYIYVFMADTHTQYTAERQSVRFTTQDAATPKRPQNYWGLVALFKLLRQNPCVAAQKMGCEGCRLEILYSPP